MLSLRVVHNFVNKFLKCSARLCVRAASLSTHPEDELRGPRETAKRAGERSARGRGAPALAFPRRFGLRRSRGGAGGLPTASPVPPAASGCAVRGRAAKATGPAPLPDRPRRRGQYDTDSSKIKPSPADPRLSQPCRFFFLNILIFLSLTSALRDPAPSRPD